MIRLAYFILYAVFLGIIYTVAIALAGARGGRALGAGFSISVMYALSVAISPRQTSRTRRLITSALFTGFGWTAGMRLAFPQARDTELIAVVTVGGALFGAATRFRFEMQDEAFARRPRP